MFIFDFDGVICDSYEALLLALQSIDREGKKLEMIGDIHRLRGLDIAKLFQIFNIHKSEAADVVTYIQKFLASRLDSLNMTAGIKEVLKALHLSKVKLGILTSNSKENVVHFLKKHDINVFDFIVSAELSNKGDNLKHIVANMEYKPQAVFYISDEVRDVLASQEAGIKSIAVGWGFNSKKVLLSCKPDYYLDTPLELLAIAKPIEIA